MVAFIDSLGLQTRYVLPASDLRTADWPKRSASLAVKTLFGQSAEQSGGIDYVFCGVDGRRYDVCVETMTLTPTSKANVIVAMSRIAATSPSSRKIVLAVFGTRDVRGLDCEIAGWLHGNEVRRWEAPEDKLLFRRRGHKFAIIPKERLMPVSLLARMVDNWKCVL